MRRAVALAVAACALVLAACTAGHPRVVPSSAAVSAGAGAEAGGRPARTPTVHGARYVGGGCGATGLLLGAAPDWARSAHPPPIRYALGESGQVAGFLFGYPLMARKPAPYSDKILWVVSSPRGGAPLRITGHPLGAKAPVVTSTWPADSSPGEIYPSDVAVPTAGCWQLTLAWRDHSDTVDLRYVRRR
jgi:hypothetical protein